MDPAVAHRHLLGEGDRREAQQLGHLDRRRPGVPVGRLRRRDDEVGLRPLDGLGQDLGRRQRVGPLEGVVAHEDGLRRSHGEGRAQARRLPCRCHRDQGDLAAARRLGQLQTHLDAVGVGVVHDELPLPDQGVGLGVEGLGRGRIGDLFHADDDVHGIDCSRERAPRTNPLGRAPGAPGQLRPGTAQSRPRWPRVSWTESVITASTPASTTASRSPGLFTVQATTARPRSCARLTSSAPTCE